MEESTRTTHDAHDVRDHDRERVPLAVAADRLGITVAAVRERVRRGTLDGVDIDGVRGVWWPPIVRSGRDARSTRTHDARTAETRRATVHDAALVDALRDEIDYLRRSLDDEREARRRADLMNAALLDRLPRLTAGDAVADAPVATNRPPGRANSSAMADEASRPESSLLGRLLHWLRGA